MPFEEEYKEQVLDHNSRDRGSIKRKVILMILFLTAAFIGSAVIVNLQKLYDMVLKFS